MQPERQATQPQPQPTRGGISWGRLRWSRRHETQSQQECRRTAPRQAGKKLNFGRTARAVGAPRFESESSDEDDHHGTTPDSSSACYAPNARHAVIGATPQGKDSDEEESEERVDRRDFNSDDWQGYTNADVEAMRMLDEESYDAYHQGGVLWYDTHDDGHVRDAWVEEHRRESDEERKSRQFDIGSHNGDADVADTEHGQAGCDVDEYE